MRYGSLRVTTADGQRREHALDDPSVVIGRAGDNGVVIDDVSISRRHARLTVEAGRPYLEDLSSEQGTYVGGHRLAPGERAILGDGTEFRVAGVSVVFLAPAAAMPGAPSAAAGPAGQAQAITVRLQGPAGTVAPGSAVAATVQVQNRGTVVDELTIQIRDIPGHWVEVTRPSVALLPGARDEVTLIFRPPRESAATGGAHPFRVSVSSREHGTEIDALGALTIGSFSAFALAIDPVRSSREFTIRAENAGNTPLLVSLEAVDEEDELDFSFGSAEVEVAPGAASEVLLAVRVRNGPKFGQERIHPFQVRGTASGAQGRFMAAGQLRYRPPWQAWKWPMVAVALLAVLAAAGLGYRAGCQDGWPACTASTDDGAMRSSSSGSDDSDGPREATPTRTATRVAGGGATVAAATTVARPSAVVTPLPPVTGRWRIDDTVTFGQDQGKTFTFVVDFTESNGRVTGRGGGLSIEGSRTGNSISVTFTRTGGSGFFEWTLGSDGRLTGRYEDHGSRNGGTSVATRQ